MTDKLRDGTMVTHTVKGYSGEIRGTTRMKIHFEHQTDSEEYRVLVTEDGEKQIRVASSKNLQVNEGAAPHTKKRKSPDGKI
ncbi:MAG TPA: hypothetical protein VNI02_03935 [Blastocatellia bacterium]|jgi:hypothetical protein|nr:hypothetical protein [Blastocatellia bacterium]